MGHSLPCISWKQDFYRVGISTPRPILNLEDQASVFVTPGDRVNHLCPWALGTHFSRLHDTHGLCWVCSPAVTTRRVTTVSKLLCHKEGGCLCCQTRNCSLNTTSWYATLTSETSTPSQARTVFRIRFYPRYTRLQQCLVRAHYHMAQSNTWPQNADPICTSLS
jgi:hypothetical protein